MLLVREASGTMATIDDIEYHDGSGMSAIGEIWYRDAGGMKLVWRVGNGMAATIPALASGYGYSDAIATITSEVVEVAVSGGTGPYTYLWEGVTDAAGWTILTPTAAASRFRFVAGAGESATATFKVTVTDSLGASVASGEVSVTIYNVAGGA